MTQARGESKKCLRNLKPLILALLEHKGVYLHMILEWNDDFHWSVVTLIPKRHMRDVKPKWTKARPDESEPTSGGASAPPPL